MKKKAFKAAFPYTIPIGIGFLYWECPTDL